MSDRKCPMNLMSVHNLAAALEVNDNRVCLVGSQRIVGSGRDWDFLILFDDDQKLTDLGFSRDLEDSHYPSLFASWRKDNINLIVTNSREFFICECTVAVAASHAAERTWDLSCREGRVGFHGAIRNEVRHHLDAYVYYIPVPSEIPS